VEFTFGLFSCILIPFDIFHLQVAPLSFVFISYVVVSLVALGRVNVPMFTALRRVTILFVVVEEWYLLRIWPSQAITNSIWTQSIGAAIAAWKDLTYDPVSYFFLFLTNLFTSLYTVYINVVKKETGLNIWAMMFYNNITTMPVLFVIAWYTGDLQDAINFPYMTDWLFQVYFQASIFLAFLLNVSTFYCTTLNTARTQNVVGQLKNFVAFLLGLVLFDDYIYDPINFLGLIIGFLGGVQYSWVSYLEKAAKDAANSVSGSLTPSATAPVLGSSNGNNNGSGNNDDGKDDEKKQLTGHASNASDESIDPHSPMSNLVQRKVSDNSIAHQTVASSTGLQSSSAAAGVVQRMTR
jgi:hypothetical protein